MSPSPSTKKAALVVCPGRGSYNAEDLGYLARHHADKAALIDAVDADRTRRGLATIRDLDGSRTYRAADHTRGDNAAALIFACAYADYLSIDRDAYDVVAVTGNSMGWYIALACGGGLSESGAIEVVNTMGALTHRELIGGQLVYPLVDEDWRPVPGRREQVLATMDRINGEPGRSLHVSIELGGMLVLGGDEQALRALQEALPPEQDRYPLRLFNHAAFHTPMMAPVSAAARARLGPALFQQPGVPLIDGRGQVWSRHASDTHALWDYTFDHQILATYDFARAVQVSVKEFAPDGVIVLGPGNTLGGPVAQSLIDIRWLGMASKSDFLALQTENPFVLSMGVPEHRAAVTSIPSR